MIDHPQHDPQLGRTPAEGVRAELRRVVDRLRSLPLSRLDRPAEGADVSRADVARRTAQALADLAADAEGAPRRPLPRLAVHGVGDQLAVVGADVLAACGPDALGAAEEQLAALRRAL
ncbi:hypothetical protein CLV92_10436 [Kineococcus xinjiangensis]|uniref:Uncharacterized protein n=1 Tax=Kineococcus xinjiangensis TaxID=512762 RepID=A0A2S6IST0_9ACTN|nr:hypothetical protein [Kineococcus xinjiangensis]PPK97221.1 hypothetical protein CLV92_10436 [Kineococcus xinjiangensis]